MELKLQNNSFNDNILRLINSSTETERFERKVPLKKGQSFFYKNKLIVLYTSNSSWGKKFW